MPERARDLPLTERRILVYGVTGSGKSTAATRIAAATGLPLHLVDELTWLPGWVPVDDDVQRERFAGIVASDEWVLDTAYAAWKDLVLQRCQLVVGLDYPRWRSLARLVRRTLIRLVDRRPICNGNVESLRGTLFAGLDRGLALPLVRAEASADAGVGDLRRCPDPAVPLSRRARALAGVARARRGPV